MPVNDFGDDGQAVAEEVLALLDEGKVWGDGAHYANGRYDLLDARLAVVT